jgi:hypothetical protein
LIGDWGSVSGSYTISADLFIINYEGKELSYHCNWGADLFLKREFEGGDATGEWVRYRLLMWFKIQ